MKGNNTLDSDLIEIEKQSLSFFVLIISLVGIGAFIGATTNLINGIVSEEYFRQIMGWDFDGVWKAAILQGIFEGLIYGFIFGGIFSIGFARITRMNVSWSFAKEQLQKITLFIYACWAIGGGLSILLSIIMSGEYDKIVYGAPSAIIPRISYAWVAGSIWGGTIGGLISIVFGLVRTNRSWKDNLAMRNDGVKQRSS
ncbi:hypothetical protein [Lewinella sp. W8]|uniref:hypothetical protein n=1 Tax=Lewinella sp. W8 TaxID=2528208 RepID=UPI001068A890|nr:hypothetical protein [Lewinella sp. W8]MTB51481.1 hypothetical protein [Lewinella sp. W8]